MQVFGNSEIRRISCQYIDLVGPCLGLWRTNYVFQLRDCFWCENQNKLKIVTHWSMMPKCVNIIIKHSPSPPWQISNPLAMCGYDWAQVIGAYSMGEFTRHGATHFRQVHIRSLLKVSVRITLVICILQPFIRQFHVAPMSLPCSYRYKSPVNLKSVFCLFSSSIAKNTEYNLTPWNLHYASEWEPGILLIFILYEPNTMQQNLIPR